MSSSKNNLPQLFDQQNAISSLNIAPISSTGTHLISARPFYRSRVTPDPFDDQREQVISHPIQRRYSSGKKISSITCLFNILLSMRRNIGTFLKYFLLTG